MNNTELKTVAEYNHKIRVMRRGAGLEQFYNMWRTATRDPEFLSTFNKGIIPIRARKDYGRHLILCGAGIVVSSGCTLKRRWGWYEKL